MHITGHNFTGPGTKLNKRLNEDMTPKAWSKPINRVDKAAYHHDICYVKNNDTKTRNEVCDKNMLTELNGIYNPTLRERMERGVVSTIIGTKKRFGWGLKKNDTIWTDQLADELHKPTIKNFPKRKVYVNGIDKIWAADLVEMQAFSKFNRGVRYLLTVIDVFSKYGWMLPLKDKTGESVADEFKEIFKKSKRKREKLWTDKGREFYNKNVKELGAEIYSTENEEKSSVAERWNRTMKEKNVQAFHSKQYQKYIDVLDDFVERYNNTRHSSIKMTPVEVSKKENEARVYRNLYPDFTRRPMRAKLKTGDKVGIQKRKGLFEKGFTPNWTEEVFAVSKNQRTSPVTCKITDLNGEEIQGTFYEQELQKTS